MKRNKIYFIIMIITVILLSNVVIFAQDNLDTYIVGTSADYPPLEWIDENGNFLGIDMDIMKIIAILEGYKIEFVDMGFDSLIPALQSGKIDIIAAGMNSTLERAKIVDFSDPYWRSDQPLLVKENSELNIITALSQGYDVGAQIGTTEAGWIQDSLINQGVKLNLKLYETNDLGIMDLVNGRIDAYMCDAEGAKVFSKNNPIKIVGIVYTGEEGNKAFAVQKGDPKNLLSKLNNGLKIVEGEIKSNLIEAYSADNLEKIRKAYEKNEYLLSKEKAPVAYTENLVKFMYEE